MAIEASKTQIVLADARSEYGADIKEELGHPRRYSQGIFSGSLISRRAYDKRHERPEENELRVLSARAAAQSLRIMCRETDSDIKIALNFVQTRELYQRMPHAGMPIDVLLMYRIREINKQGEEETLYDLLKVPDYFEGKSVEEQKMLQEMIPGEKRPLPIITSKTLQPGEQKPVVVVCYQTLEDAIKSAQENGKRPSQKTIESWKKDDEVMKDVLTLQYWGLLFYPAKNLLNVGKLVKEILADKERYSLKIGKIPLIDNGF